MFQFTDSTASSQRIGIDNSRNIEFGSHVPSQSFTVQGKKLMASSTLAPATCPPKSLGRITGSVTVPAYSTATVTVPALAGLGTVTGAGVLVYCHGTSVTAGNAGSTSITANYSVI